MRSKDETHDFRTAFFSSRFEVKHLTLYAFQFTKKDGVKDETRKVRTLTKTVDIFFDRVLMRYVLLWLLFLMVFFVEEGWKIYAF